MERIVISCLESRIESDRSIYARFLLGPFTDDALTIATALRRSLLSKVKSIAITAIHIQGVTHEFSTIVGVRESVLDLALNFQQIVLRQKKNRQAERFARRAHDHKQNEVSDSLDFIEQKRLFSKDKHDGVLKRQKQFEEGSEQKLAIKPSFKSTNFYKSQVGKKRNDSTFEGGKSFPEPTEIGYLQMQGPAVIYANDLKLPAGIECVDPTQYIATISGEGSLVVKFLIGGKKGWRDSNTGILTGDKLLTNTFNPGKPLLDWGKPLLTKRFSSKKPLSFNKSVNSVVTNDSNLVAVEPTVTESRSRLPNDAVKSRDRTNVLRDTLFLDPIFDSVFQVNYIIEKDDLFNKPRERIVLELWTNGSVHPRQALHTASLSLISTFSVFRQSFQLDSL